MSFAESTLHDGSLIEYLHRLNRQLDMENANIDEKLEGIDPSAYRRKVAELAQAEASAKAIENLQQQLAMLRSQTIDREVIASRARHIKCPGCKSSIDGRAHVLGLASSTSRDAGNESAASNSSRNDELQRALMQAQEQLERQEAKWKRQLEEVALAKSNLQEENGALRVAAQQHQTQRSQYMHSAQKTHSATKVVSVRLLCPSLTFTDKFYRRSWNVLVQLSQTSPQNSEASNCVFES